MPCGRASTPFGSGTKVHERDSYGSLPTSASTASWTLPNRAICPPYAPLLAADRVRNGSMWQVDFQGRTVHAFLFDNTGELRYPVEDHEFGDENYVLSDYVKYEVMGNYGIIDRTNGRVITPAIYSDIYMLSERLFEVRRMGSNEWYLLDGRGNEVER